MSTLSDQEKQQLLKKAKNNFKDLDKHLLFISPSFFKKNYENFSTKTNPEFFKHYPISSQLYVFFLLMKKFKIKYLSLSLLLSGIKHLGPLNFTHNFMLLEILNWYEKKYKKNFINKLKDHITIFIETDYKRNKNESFFYIDFENDLNLYKMFMNFFNCYLIKSNERFSENKKLYKKLKKYENDYINVKYDPNSTESMLNLATMNEFVLNLKADVHYEENGIIQSLNICSKEDEFVDIYIFENKFSQKPFYPMFSSIN